MPTMAKDTTLPTYLRTVNNQLTAILNHAARFYGLNPNPAVRTMKMGSKDTKEMNFWTKEEYLKFADIMMESPMFFVIFEILYWTGIREGELLALTPDSFDWSHNTMRIDKSYQRLGGHDVITDPKTPKSIRTVKLPNFLSRTTSPNIPRSALAAECSPCQRANCHAL